MALSCVVTRNTLRLSLQRRISSSRRFFSYTNSNGYTKIEKLVLDHIKATGPISFATYTNLCLSHPTHGYYMNPEHDVFGRKGDFVTSPDMNQIFGELISLWFLGEYMLKGSGRPLRLVELGPGSGRLMGDILRVISSLGPKARIDVHLVETSSALREKQKTYLTSDSSLISDRYRVHFHWHNLLSELLHPSADTNTDELPYTMLVANEFFDALPVIVLHKSKETGQWHEVLVASNDEDLSVKNDNNSTLEGQEQSIPSPPDHVSANSNLRWVLSRNPSSIGAVVGDSSERFKNLPPGSYLEVSPAAFRIARQVGELLHGKSSGVDGGCGLIIDYGADRAFQDSLRAFKKHKIVDVFHEPGNCDITANVDFAYLREAMGDIVNVMGPVTQSSFLHNLHFERRVEGLMKKAATADLKEGIHESSMRLVDPAGMGTQYKVLGVCNLKNLEGSQSGNEDARNAGPGPSSQWPFIEKSI